MQCLPHVLAGTEITAANPMNEKAICRAARKIASAEDRIKAASRALIGLGRVTAAADTSKADTSKADCYVRGIDAGDVAVPRALTRHISSRVHVTRLELADRVTC